MDKFTVLLAGIDDFGEADAIMVGLLDGEAGTLNMVSIPRDTLVNASGESKRLRLVYNEGGAEALRQAVAGRCEILDGTQEESVYRTLKLHVESDADVRGVISAVNDAVELRSFREIIPSMNDIFIRAVNGAL